MSHERWSEVHLDVEPGRDAPDPTPLSDHPFCLAILGDFGGRESRAAEDSALSGRRPIRFDRDTVEAVLARIGPRLELSAGAQGELRFQQLDDFHPDRLYTTQPLFRTLRESRARLQDPAVFRDVVARARESPDQTVSTAEAAEALARPRPSGDLLDQIIESSPGGRPEAQARPDDLEVFLQRIVKPHVVRDADPVQSEMLARVDAEAADLMRRVLHHPRLQRLESAWRSAFFLASRIETDEKLQLHLIDISKDELAADLAPDRPTEETGTYKLMVESSVGTPGAVPWAAFIGCYTFGPDLADVALLTRLAEIARLAGAPWIADGHPGLAGCESFHETPDPSDWKLEIDPAWDAFRLLVEARSVGLALPRFLLRLPYGRESDPCELLDFEEVEGTPTHDDYLWGSPAVAVALLLAEAYSSSGWALRLGTNLEVGRLPLHIYRSNGEAIAKPCAEILLTERAAERLLERGLMPLVSIKDTDKAWLIRVQSAARPLAPLAGRWTPLTS